MKLQDIMTSSLVKIHPDTTVDVAARALAHHNIGALPVCAEDGRLCGLVTDRDLVTRCVASGRAPEKTKVREVMTASLVCGEPGMDVGAAAHLMGRKQVRRLPVTKNGKLCGMVSLGDIACREETGYDAADALSDISSNLSQR